MTTYRFKNKEAMSAPINIKKIDDVKLENQRIKLLRHSEKWNGRTVVLTKTTEQKIHLLDIIEKRRNFK
jgi:hypothetical protein